jgi:hypothetical protein
MNKTLETLISNTITEINEGVIDNLTAFGYTHQEATKVVSEFSDFDLAANAAQFPVTESEISF